MSSPSRRSLLALSIVIFFMADVHGGVGPILSIYLHSTLGWDSSQIGIALATVGFTGAIFQIPSGLYVDATHHKRFLIGFACVLVIFSCLIFLSQTAFLLIILAQALVGIATTLILPSIAAITLGLVGRQRFPVRVTVNESIDHIGTVFAIIFIGLLATLYGHSWIVYGTMMLAFLTILPLFFINPCEISHAIARELPQLNDNKAEPVSIIQLARYKPILILFSAILLFHFTNGAQLPLIGQKLARINPDRDSLFMASCIVLAQIIMATITFSLGYVINTIGRKTIFLFAFVFTSLRAFLFSYIYNPYYLLLAQLLDGVSAGIYSAMVVIMISDLAAGTGRFNFLLGVLGLCVSIGSSVSNTVIGHIAKLYGFHVGFLALAYIAAIGWVVYFFILPETKPLNNNINNYSYKSQ